MREINDGNIPSATDYDITEKEYFNIIEVCQDEGLIKNAIPVQTLRSQYKIFLLDRVILTVKGMEYLNNNSAAMKTYKGLKELRDWLPF